jgi:hypothetical protein
MKLYLAIVFLTALTSVHAKEATWSCTKDGKTIEVKGEKPKEKQASCEAAQGVWAEVKDQIGKLKRISVPVQANPRQDPGGGGSW